MRRRLNKWHVGRLRERASELLREAFPAWDVFPEDIKPASGAWRTDWRQDVYRWELFTRLKVRCQNGDAFPVVVGCWETLTRFVKFFPLHGCHEEGGVIYLGRLPMKIRVTPQDIGYPEITLPGSLVTLYERAERAGTPDAWLAVTETCFAHEFPRPAFTDAWEADYAAITWLVKRAARGHLYEVMRREHSPKLAPSFAVDDSPCSF